jgi:adenine-specific DNA-methyltransferase
MVKQLEAARQTIQGELDALKTQAERNRLGQFATPPALALDVLKTCRELLPKQGRVRFLDPAIGTGSFYSALLQVFPPSRITSAVGYEIDPHYGDHTARLWRDTLLTIHLADFTSAAPPTKGQPNLIVCNPPYVRHHHIDAEQKGRLQRTTFEHSGMHLSGLSGLYCHFLGICHGWMPDGGLAAWLIPSEFMDVNYGRAVKNYLLSRVTLRRIHRFDPNDLQFSDALVSSAVVIFSKAKPPPDHAVTFTYGGTLQYPKISKAVPADRLSRESKWTRHPLEDIAAEPTTGMKLSDLFKIKRGLASGANNFFVMTGEQAQERGIPDDFLTPVLPSPRYLVADAVEADAQGVPLLDRRLFLFSSELSEAEMRARFPAMSGYLEEGRAKKVHETYICAHREPWYKQEDRPAAPLLCTYLSRQGGGRPFRFIRNRSRATATNVYLLLYPQAKLARLIARDSSILDRVWKAMNTIAPDRLTREGRVYGGGLHKLEPKELANAPADVVLDAVPELRYVSDADRQLDLFRVGV